MKKIATKQRILDAARDLFNEEGAGEVTTHDVAAACGISPGNLYYHYRNKEEIIRDLFEASLTENARFQQELVSVEAAPGERKERALAFAKEISWRYRFFKRELPMLLKRDPVLARKFRSFHREHLEATQRDLQERVASAGAPALTRDEARWLAEISWLMVLFWPSFVEVAGGKRLRSEMDRGIDMISWLFDRCIEGGSQP